MSTSKFRETLNKPTAALIADVVRFDKDKALDLQARLLAIHKAEADLPREAQQDLYGIRDEAKLTTALKKAGVTDAGIAEAHADVVSEKGMPRAVPMLGMVATSFRLVSNDIKNALMAAQAGERTIRAGELMGGMRADALPAALDHLLPGTVIDARNPAEPARGFIGKFKDDPPNLVAAQAIHHLADLATASAALGVAAADAEKLTMAATDIGVLGRRALIGAGDDLMATGQHGPAEQTYAIMGPANGLDETPSLHRLHGFVTHQLDRHLASGMVEANIKDAWQALVDKRVEQARAVLHTGPSPSADNHGPRSRPTR
jgi:hypothetical protein